MAPAQRRRVKSKQNRRPNPSQPANITDPSRAQAQTPATMGLQTTPTVQPFLAPRFSNAPTSQYPQGGNAFGGGVSFPNYETQWRTMPMATNSGPNAINNGEIRNPNDLLEAIKARPHETFEKIRDLGAENILLKNENAALRLEMEEMVEENRERDKRRGEQFQATLAQLYSVQEAKETVLHVCIGRLQDDICELRGGGRVMHGSWFSDEEFQAGSELVASGEITWNELVDRKVMARHAPAANSSGSTEDDIKDKVEARDDAGNGNGRETGKESQPWNPNAQAFVPSVAGSSGKWDGDKSDITEVFRPTAPPSTGFYSQPTTVPFQSTYQYRDQNAVLLPTATIGTSPTSSMFLPGILASTASSTLPLRPNFEHHKRNQSPLAGSSNATPSPSTSKPSSTAESSSNTPKGNSTSTILTQTAPMPDTVLSAISNKLPPVFRAICPFSLTGLEVCPVGTCTMKKLCKDWNDYRIDRDTCANTNTNCRFVHEYATCIDALDAEHGGKGDAENGICSKVRGAGKRNQEARVHAKKRVHADSCGLEEWKNREIIAGLRKAHREGRYA